MTSFRRVAVALSVAAAMGMTSLSAMADDHHDQDHHDAPHFVRHDEWHKGGHIGHDDWVRGEHVDYHAHHLRTPPHGYEWRAVDGNFVLAAVATGVIASIIVNAH